MLRKQSSRRLGSWLAMLAVALNALWPLLAHAGGGSLIEVCTSTGMKWIAADNREQQPEHKSLAPHCESCSLGAERAPLPSSPAIVPIKVSIAIAVIAPSESAPVVSQSCFSRALPRAPPVLS